MRSQYLVVPATFLLALLLAQTWFFLTIEPSPWKLTAYVLANSLLACAMLLGWDVLSSKFRRRRLAMVGFGLLWFLIAYVLIQTAAALTFGTVEDSGRMEAGVARHAHLQYAYDAVYLTLAFIAGPLAGPRGAPLGIIGRLLCGALAALGVVFVVAARV